MCRHASVVPVNTKGETLLSLQCTMTASLPVLTVFILAALKCEHNHSNLFQLSTNIPVLLEK